jgi:hypothetical protein
MNAFLGERFGENAVRIRHAPALLRRSLADSDSEIGSQVAPKHLLYWMLPAERRTSLSSNIAAPICFPTSDA